MPSLCPLPVVCAVRYSLPGNPLLTPVPHQAKASGKKLQKVTLKVSPRGIILTDSLTSQLIENVSIYRYARVYSATLGDAPSVLSESRLYSFLSGSPEPEFLSSVKWAWGRFLCGYVLPLRTHSSRGGWGGSKDLC